MNIGIALLTASLTEVIPCLANRNVQHLMVSRIRASLLHRACIDTICLELSNNRLPAALVQLGRAGDFPVTSCGRYSSQLTGQEGNPREEIPAISALIVHFCTAPRSPPFPVARCCGLNIGLFSGSLLLVHLM